MSKPLSYRCVNDRSLSVSAKHLLFVVFWASVWLTSTTLAETTVQMHKVDTQGTTGSVGTVTLSESPHGLVFSPQLKGLEPGLHGFHVHENASCDAAQKDGKTIAAGAAGEHFDPESSGKHDAPWGDGHLGDLPALYVDSDGNATQPVLAPRIKAIADISERSLMLHKGGDNHSDHPKPAGGGGARIACGIIAASQ